MSKVKDREHVVFAEQGQPNQYLKLIVSGDLDDILLEALQVSIERQRKRRIFALTRLRVSN